MNDEIDPILQTDLTNTDTRDPLLPKGNYRAEVLSVAQNTSESGSKMLRVLAKTLEVTQDVNGNTVPVGHLLNQTIFLSPNEYNSVADIQKELKKFMVGLGVTSGQLAPLDQWKGKVGNARVAVAKATDRYPDPSNKITGWVS